MLKKVVMTALVFCAALGAFAEPYKLKNADFKEGLKFWTGAKWLSQPPEKMGFAIEKNENETLLVGIGPQNARQLVQSIEMKTEDLLNKKVRFGATVKPEKLSGTFNVMIREINAQGKSIRYRKLSWNKYSPQEWKKAVSEFVVMKPTVRIQFYIKAEFLAEGDRVLLKEPFIEISGK